MNINYLPPEWAQQSAILLTWPHKQSDWAPLLAQVDQTFVDIAKTISRYEQVIVACFNQIHVEHVWCLLKKTDCILANISLFVSPSNDCWVRDHGPISVFKDKHLVLLDFGFNGWGNKFDATLDNRISRELHKLGAFKLTPIESKDFVLEGGSVEVDGKGGILTTTSCLLASSRNPGKSQAQIEAKLMQEFGVNRFYWLRHGYLSGDDTDGHIDTLARFTDEHTIAYSACNDPQDEQFTSLQKMEQELSLFRDWKGEPFKLVPLVIPKPILDAEGQRLPANYTNFLIINNAILVPIYNDPADEYAIEHLKRCFSDRKIISVDCSTLIHQAGSLHCATMQLPLIPSVVSYTV